MYPYTVTRAIVQTPLRLKRGDFGTPPLAEHRRMSEGPDSPVPDDVVRFSVGSEAVEELIADVGQAFSRLSA